MPKTNLGPVALKPKGEYSNTASYTRLDVVTYRGGSYVALQSLTGKAPVENTTNANWQCIAQKGDKGDTGQAGNTGSAGPSGADGFSPEAKVEETNTGATISITDKSGTTTATVRHGIAGEAATVQIGTVTTGTAGSQAEVKNRGTSREAVFDFKIPKGDKGADGTMTFEDLTEEQKDSLKGDTPFIGENGNWWVGATDTGVKAGVSVDATLTLAGQAADAKAVGDAINTAVSGALGGDY